MSSGAGGYNYYESVYDNASEDDYETIVSTAVDYEPSTKRILKKSSRSDVREMTDNDMAHCRQLFKALDRKKKGRIDKKSLIILITKSLASLDLEAVSQEMVESLATEMMNNKSYISEKDFLKLYEEYIHGGHISGSNTHHRSSVKQILRNATGNKSKSKKGPAYVSNTRVAQIYFENHYYRIIWGALYILLNVLSFYWKYDRYCNRRPEAYALSGVGLCVARGLAQVCLLNAGLILLPLCHSLLQFLRQSSSLASVIPFDDAILFHKVIGYNLVTSGLGHTGFQLYSFFNNVQKAPDATFNASALAASGAFKGPKPSLVDFLGTIPGWTGAALVGITLVATPFTLQHFRKSNFTWFWLSHLLFYPFYMALFFFHGIQSWLEPTQAWIFTTIPILIYTVDRWNRMKLYASAPNIKVQDIGLSDDAIQLKLDKPKNGGGRFDNFVPGTYLYLNVPMVSQYEWHPFTISSAPDDEYLSLHIRVVGDWTSELYKLCERALKTSDKNGGASSDFKVKVDGPIGAPTQEYLNYEVVVMIGAGIGVTPFASILRDTAYRLQDATCQTCDKVHYDTYVPWSGTRSVLTKLYFHWTTRSQDSLGWFATAMNELTEFDIDEKIEIHNHLTTVSNDSKDATVAKAAQTLYHQMTGVDFVSGLETRTRTHFGRPDWDMFFSEMSKKHPGEEIGVFFCGSRSLEAVLKNMCVKYSAASADVGTRFDFHAEKF